MKCPICDKVILNCNSGFQWWCFHRLKTYCIGFANQDGGFTYIRNMVALDEMEPWKGDLILKGLRILDEDQIDKLMVLR